MNEEKYIKDKHKTNADALLLSTNYYLLSSIFYLLSTFKLTKLKLAIRKI